MIELIKKLEKNRELTREEYARIICEHTEESDRFLFQRASALRQEYYGNRIYLRGLIEFTSFCRNNCYYCGIRRGARSAERYRLSEEEILSCCDKGYGLGFRTFVLQGGEDGYYTDDMICEIVSEIKRRHSDCAVTLSIGEKPRESYERYFAAGADRYLLRHETADDEHYRRLHPPEMSPENRRRCLRDLKEIGYQTGCGFMVGSPWQTPESLADDLLFCCELQPHMVGIGPFIPHHDTPFADMAGGTLSDTLLMLGLVRLTLPKVLLPATTALGTIDPRGRELGILAGANVVMPNLSPKSVRKKYLLYDNKICTGEEAAECTECLGRRIASVGCVIGAGRGDHVSMRQNG